MCLGRGTDECCCDDAEAEARAQAAQEALHDMDSDHTGYYAEHPVTQAQVSALERMATGTETTADPYQRTQNSVFAAIEAQALPCCFAGREYWDDRAGGLVPVGCCCGHTERVIRAYAYGTGDGAEQATLPAMTEEQRAWLAHEADHAASQLG